MQVGDLGDHHGVDSFLKKRPVISTGARSAEWRDLVFV
jgi:hypothetical protein